MTPLHASASGGSGRAGTTLLELLTVIAIVMITAGIVAALFSNAQRRARESRARTDLELVKRAVIEYRLKYGSYPDATNWSRSALTNWTPKGFSFVDPWGRQYIYRLNGAESCSIRSAGADGKEGTEDDIIAGG